MYNPWDIPPLPKRGDDDQDTTFAGVGRVLTQWEMIEVRLAEIYSWLDNRPEEIEALQDYGKPQIFKERMKALRIVADVYFRGTPHQATEGEFYNLTTKVSNFSARRNDVAHSIVTPFNGSFHQNWKGLYNFVRCRPTTPAKKSIQRICHRSFTRRSN